jgi:hypothetical protein
MSRHTEPPGPVSLTVRQAAVTASVSASMVYPWVKQKRFPVRRLGGRDRGKIVIDKTTYCTFSDAQTVLADSPASPALEPPVAP